MSWTDRRSSDATAEQAAEKIAEHLARCRDDYRLASRNLNEDGPWRADPAAHLQRLRRVSDCAATLHEAVENAIVRTDILSAHQSELWAKDLASTAFNVLDSIPSLYRRLNEEFQALGEPPPRPSQDAFYAMECAVATYNPDQVPDLMERFKALNLPTRGFTHPAQMNKYTKSEWNVILVTGIGLILLMLAVAVFNERFNNFNVWLFRVVTALAAALLAGAALPGLLEIKGKVGPMLIRAGGSLAVLILIFYINPPGLVVNAIQTSDHPKAVASPPPTVTPSTPQN